LELPNYSSKEIARAKLIYACSHCQAIDLDHDVQGSGSEQEEE